MARNVRNQEQSKELFSLKQLKSTHIVPAILKATATKFLKVMYVWGSR